MQQLSAGTRVQVYFGETDQVGHRPRYQVLLEYLRREGAAGATVTRGVAGFGHNSRIHTSAILRLSEDLPMVLTWIDAPERAARLLPELRELAGSGVITVEEVGLASYGERRLEQLRFDLPVSDVMTRTPTSVTPDDSARTAVERLVGQEFRAVPVVEADGSLVGIVSNGDLVERAGLSARLDLLDAMAPEQQSGVIGMIPVDLRVGDIMTPEPVSVPADRKVGDAMRLMSEHRIKRLPVIDSGGRLVGILSRGDLLRAVAETFPRREPQTAEHHGARTVGELMRRDVPAVAADADLAALLDAVISTRLNRAVVVDESRRVLGVVSDADVLRNVGATMKTGVVGALMGAGGLGHTEKRAADLLTGKPLTLPSDASIGEAARLAMEQRRKVLPVVDDEGRLLGILDRADLLHASRSALDQLVAEDHGDDDE